MPLLEKFRIRPGDRFACTLFAAACIVKSATLSVSPGAFTLWKFILMVVFSILAFASHYFIALSSPEEEEELQVAHAHIFLSISCVVELVAAILLGGGVSFLLGLALMVAFVDLRPLTPYTIGKSQ